MKKYLLTWYGITDLRASLGLEESGGPILSAIKTGDYTNVMILSYTDPQKKNPENFADIDENDFCRMHSNTDSAHDIYRNWLKDNIERDSLDTLFTLYKIPLKKLNDTKGIYKAVSKVIDIVSSDSETKDITFFLSPGTPVMAFVWALTSLANPSLKIKVIASSIPNKPPELISLPYKLMDTTISQKIKKSDNRKKFDAIFHLFGAQRLPVIFAINHFESKNHIFLNSSDYPADIMLNFINKQNFEQISVKPFDPKDVEIKILNRISRFQKNTKIGFNLTGGTKLMYAGAISAAKKVNGIPFYFESKNNNLIYLNDFSIINSKKIRNVETFIKLNTQGLIVSNSGRQKDDPKIYDKERRKLTKELYKNKDLITTLYYDLGKNDSSSFSNTPGKPFSIDKGKISASLNNECLAEIKINDKHLKFENWLNFADYLHGKWFEEYAFFQLLQMQDSGYIYDLRMGLEISIDKDKSTDKNLDWQTKLAQLVNVSYQELDICFTHKNTLYIVECKSGRRVSTKHINKLETIRRLYGGNECQAILYTAFPLSMEVTKKRVADYINIHHTYARQLDMAIKKIIKK